MRLWTLHPRYLDAQGLVALWREALLAREVLRIPTQCPRALRVTARWWWRVNIIWWPWQAARRVWRELPPGVRERFHPFDERRSDAHPAAPAARAAAKR